MAAAFSSTSVVAAAALLIGSISSSIKLSPAYTTIASLSKNLSFFSLISNPLLSHNPLTLTASATSKRSFTCKSQSSPPDSTTPRKARLETFQSFCEALGKKCGGDSNMKFAWYGGSKNEIRDIISHGFTHCKEPENRGLYGVGVSLPPAKFSMESALLLDDDDNGLRHILLCRVILGKMEQICEGSKQFHRSSEEFDSGVYMILQNPDDTLFGVLI